MVLSEFIDYATKYKWADYVGMEDFADKLSFSMSTSILLLLTLVITVKSYLLTSIACYIPVHPTGKDFDDFLKSYCWVHGTIPINNNYVWPKDELSWEEMDNNNRISKDINCFIGLFYTFIFRLLSMGTIRTCSTRYFVLSA